MIAIGLTSPTSAALMVRRIGLSRRNMPGSYLRHAGDPCQGRQCYLRVGKTVGGRRKSPTRRRSGPRSRQDSDRARTPRQHQLLYLNNISIVEGINTEADRVGTFQLTIDKIRDRLCGWQVPGRWTGDLGPGTLKRARQRESRPAGEGWCRTATSVRRMLDDVGQGEKVDLRTGRCNTQSPGEATRCSKTMNQKEARAQQGERWTCPCGAWRLYGLS
jgi:hypothetical protein